MTGDTYTNIRLLRYPLSLTGGFMLGDIAPFQFESVLIIVCLILAGFLC